MRKKVNFKIRGYRADIGDVAIYRLLPNQYTYHVGHFVFLDYIPPFPSGQKRINPGAAHPHRGIATVSYILNGEVDHYDSYGNRATVHSGGVQWMKAGNGIIHNEVKGADTNTKGRLSHGFQFWINLPGKIKKEAPAYMALESEDLPMVMLQDDTGTLKVVVGEYKGLASKIPTYATQYLYHIRLNAGKQFSIPTEDGLEYAIFLPQHDLTINGKEYHNGDLIGFDDKEGDIEITNNLGVEADIILFGGEKYTEPFIAQGPFVMNTKEEIHEAVADYQNGKYGEIEYN